MTTYGSPCARSAETGERPTTCSRNVLLRGGPGSLYPRRVRRGDAEEGTAVRLSGDGSRGWCAAGDARVTVAWSTALARRRGLCGPRRLEVVGR